MSLGRSGVNRFPDSMTIVCLFNPNHHWLQYTHIYPPLHMRHTYCHSVHLYTAQSTKVYVPSSELGLSHPLSRQRVCPYPRYQRGGGHTRLRVRGWGSPNSDERTYTVVLFIFMYFVDISILRHGGIWKAAYEAVVNKVHKKIQNYSILFSFFYSLYGRLRRQYMMERVPAWRQHDKCL